MTYLVCYVWQSTVGNHTGMSHMCDLMVQKYPQKFFVLKYYQHNPTHLFRKKRLNRCVDWLKDVFENIRITILVLLMLFKLQKGDKVLLTEYLFPQVCQLGLARMIKKFCPTIPIYAMAHLTPSKLKSFNLNENQMYEWNRYVDYFVTLGSNLTDYIVSMGIPRQKIITTRHYVDRQYYSAEIDKSESFSVITMGNVQRKYQQLENIIKACSTISFVVCSGRDDISYLSKYPNVRLLGFLPEEALRDEMARASVSLSVMEDTVGSNVIVTSMAMGLCQVVSDVGAIRDYCNEENACFCTDTNDFVKALQFLNTHQEELYEKRLNAQTAVGQYSLERFISDLAL